MLVGIGASWFDHSHTLSTMPKGSGVNGLSSTPPFSYTRLQDAPDRPGGILRPDGTYHFNEDWIAHSHAYVSAVAVLEAGYALRIGTRNGGFPVRASVTVSVAADSDAAGNPNGELRRYETDESGAAEIADLPAGADCEVSVAWNGTVLRRRLGTVGGGQCEWFVDFADAFDIAVSAPAFFPLHGEASGTVEVTHRGTRRSDFRLALRAGGIGIGERDRTTEELAFALDPGRTVRHAIALHAGSRATTFTLRAYAECGGNACAATAAGKIGTAETVQTRNNEECL
jgi:hypothetical protein